MDNFSEENYEKEVAKEVSPVEDIQFEDTLDVEKIEQKLIETINDADEDAEDNDDIEFIDEEVMFESKKEQEFIQNEKSEDSEILPAHLETKVKKYVIYIEADNIDYVEGLSIEKRREIINNILREQHLLDAKTKRKAEIDKFFKQGMIASLTFIIGFPILFFIVNYATDATLYNYRYAKKNFERIYQQNGKIKPINTEKMPTVKY